MTRDSITARRPSAQENCYSWVWVLPIPSGQFRVAAIEVPKHLVDNDICFYDDDFTTVSVEMIDDVDDVDEAVRRAGVDPEALHAPWHNDFPL